MSKSPLLGWIPVRALRVRASLVPTGLVPACLILGGMALAPAPDVWARPVDVSARLPRPHLIDLNTPSGLNDPAGSGATSAGLSAGAALNDTAFYGGTALDGAPDPIPGQVPVLRKYKALRSTNSASAIWNFSTGVGSNFTEPTQVPKPPGYHHRMEGWYGLDQTYNPQPYYRRSSQCALAGAFSFYAGVTTAEANALCYTSPGYGNNWNLTIGRTFTYPGTGSVTLSYKYRTECEPNFDYLNVNIDTTGTGAMDDISLKVYTGDNPLATESITLVRGVTLRSTAGPITIKFNVWSDGGYSDEDGGYPTVCGHSSIDDVTLTGAISSVSTFEAGDGGWVRMDPTTGPGGDYSDLRSLASLPPPLSFCPCSVADSVLLFAGSTGGHGGSTDNIACSPWCDLAAGGDVGRPGKVLLYSGYFELSLTNYIFVQALASWYPAICPQNGQVYLKPPTSDGFSYYFGGVPSCTAPGSPVVTEFSALIPPTAEQVKICVGVLSYCSMFANCTGVSNTTPWYDRVQLGVYGTAGAPIVNLRTIDVFQDNFAADGTLNPSSTGRIDTNNVKGASVPSPGSALGDTLIVNGDGGNTEVRVVFHVRPGPFTNAAALAAWAAAKWTAEPGIGPAWYSARCDTAEQAGSKAPKWMGTLHESDPKFGGGTDTDRGGEGDFSQLSHDIFPDHILTPGARIDYFVKARYIPPDPRNPGGTGWFITPDTTGRSYAEVEILPSSMAADTSWNCVLYVDHHADRDVTGQRLEEQGLTAALGLGGANAEGTRYDRYDVQAPSSQQASLGRPLNTQYGASIVQTFAYKAIAWHSSNLASFNLVDEDANNLTAWLTIAEVGLNRFWASGDGVARGITSENEPTTLSFLGNICGVRFTCDTIRLASCPAGSVLDSTFCLPLVGVAGADFATALPANARGNGCPNIRSFDLLAASTSIPSARGQLAYQKTDGIRNYASITNHNVIDVDYKTVVDGVSVGYLRDPHGNIHNAALCDITTPAVARSGDVLQWFRQPAAFSICRLPGGEADSDPPNPVPGPPAYRTRLTSVYPNPMNPTTRIRYTAGPAAHRVTLSIFDVTGRLVRTLVDEPQAAGPHEVGWDGRDERGQGVGSGLFFVKLSTRDAVESRKIVVSK